MESTFEEIKVFDDAISDMDIVRNLIKTEDREKPFYIADIGNIIKKHEEWITKMPRVIPHFAIKCNPDPTVIKVLAALNAGFNCACEQEMKQVMQHGVRGNRIILGHCTKYPSDIRYAKRVGVKQMMVDDENEILKIKELFPDAKIVIHIRCDSKDTSEIMGLKFGCDPDKDAVRLIHLIKDLDLNLHGFSFHVDSPCKDMEAYAKGIALCNNLITISKAIGCDNVQLINISGGFPGEKKTDIDKFASVVNEAIKDLDSNIKVISEPGSYYVNSSFTLASYLHSKRVISKNGELVKMYYLNCGVFQSFMENLLGLESKVPQLLSKPKSDKKFLSILWGPTLYSNDLIIKNVMLPELEIGDWVLWENMGAYSVVLSSTFNGFPIPYVIPIIRKSQWEKFKAKINLK